MVASAIARALLETIDVRFFIFRISSWDSRWKKRRISPQKLKEGHKSRKENRDSNPKNLCGFRVLLCVFCGHLTLDQLSRRTSLLIRSLSQLPATAPTDARPAIVSHRRVIEIGHAAPGLINQLPDARHL